MMSASAAARRPVPAPKVATDFSLVLGGPLYQMLLRARLVRPPLELLHRRMVLIPLFTWLPLLALTLLEGTALGGVTVPFLQDVEAYARFLVAIPMLLVAELVVHRRLRPLVGELRERDIVDAGSHEGLETAVSSAMRLRNSIPAEIAMLAFVFIVGPMLWMRSLALPTDTWYARIVDGRSELTWAGTWFLYVGAPAFQFLLLRWYFRLGIWWRFLWQVSRLPLDLKALHPDRAGGLGFLGISLYAFTPLLVAQSVVVSGIVFNRVFAGAASAMDFRGEIGLMVALLVALIVAPLMFFSPDMVEARRIAMVRFGLLATDYAREFEHRWLRGTRPTDEPLLGSADIQSLNDLAGSHDVVSEMRPFPFNFRMLLRVVLVTAAPFFPLVLTVIPFGELVQRVAGMLL